MAKKTTKGETPVETTALTEHMPQAVAERPDWLKTGDTRGAENVAMSDLRIPRLLIAQDLSPQMKSSKPEYIEGLKSYDMFNSLTGQIYGRGPLTFVPIRMDKRAIEWYPRDSKEGEGIKDRDVAWDDPRCQFGPGGEPPVATRYYDVIALLLPTFEPIVISLHNSQFKHGQTLLSLIKMRGAFPFWAGLYTVQVVEESKDKYLWGGFKFGEVKTPDGKRGWTPADVAARAEETYAAFAGKKLADDEADRFDPADYENDGSTAPASTSAADVVGDSV